MELFLYLARLALFFACAVPASIEDLSTGRAQRKWTDFLLASLPLLALLSGGAEECAASLAGGAGAVLLCSAASAAGGFAASGSAAGGRFHLRKAGFGAADIRMAGAVGALAGFQTAAIALAAAALLSFPFFANPSAHQKGRSVPFLPSLTAGAALASVFFRAKTFPAAISIAGWITP